MGNCEQELAKILSDGKEHNVIEIREMRATKGYTKQEVNEAKRKLGVEVTNDSYQQEDGKALNWFWRLKNGK